MRKVILVFVLGLICLQGQAQQRDTIVHFVKADGNLTMSRDSAECIRFILPPDSSIDRKLFHIQEFYSNGKRKLTAATRYVSKKSKFEGPTISFFPEGQRKSFINYKNGNIVGDMIYYYPNGRLYAIKRFQNDQLKLVECRDSTGVILTNNGNGSWIDYNDLFTVEIERATIKNYVKRNATIVLDTLAYLRYDKAGEVITSPDAMPYLGVSGRLFYELIGEFVDKINNEKIIKYSVNDVAKVMVTFTVEPDGSLTHISTTPNLNKHIAEEAFKIVSRSPAWVPGYVQGKPVRVKCTFPVSYILGVKQTVP